MEGIIHRVLAPYVADLKWGLVLWCVVHGIEIGFLAMIYLRVTQKDP